MLQVEQVVEDKVVQDQVEQEMVEQVQPTLVVEVVEVVEVHRQLLEIILEEQVVQV